MSDENTIRLRLMSLTGPYKCVSELDARPSQALPIVRAHVEPHGYSNVRAIYEDDGFSIRYTATTPGGRHGRNVAYGDVGYEGDSDSADAVSSSSPADVVFGE